MWQVPLIILIAADVLAIVLLLAFLGRLRSSLSGRRAWRVVLLALGLLALIAATVVVSVRHLRHRAIERHYEAGQRLLRRGDVKGAQEEFSRTLQRDPDHEEAQEALEEIESRRREAAQARGGQLTVGSSPADEEGLPHPERRPSPIEILSYELDARIEPDTGSLAAEARLQVRSKEKRLSKFRLSLCEEAEVAAVRFGGSPVEYERKADWLHLTPKVKLRKQPVEVVVEYDLAVPDDKPFLSGGDMISDRGVYLRPESRWYPAAGFLEFRSPTKAAVTVPSGFFAVAPGALLSETETAGRTTFVWDCSQPANGIAVAAGKYESRRARHNGIDFGVYLFPEHAQHLDAYLTDAQEIVDYYERCFGKYPFSKLYLVEIPEFPGGYGPTSFVMLGEVTVEDRDELGIEFVAHEVAHQWWGSQLLPQGPGAGWLSEAFAEYSSFLFVEDREGAPGLKRCLADAEGRYHESRALGPEEPISHTDPLDHTGAYSGVVYSKGAYVLHMLRRRVGRKKFVETLRTLADRHKGGVVQIEDFKRTAEQVSQQRLDWFFEQWFERTGAIELAYDYSVEPMAGGAYRTTLVVAQQTPRPYRGELLVRLRLADRAVDHTESLRDERHVFQYDTSGQPLDIDFDPDDDLLMMTPRRRALAAPGAATSPGPR